MRAGALRHVVAIEGATLTRGEGGVDAEAWTEEATVAASVEPLAGRELFAAQQAGSRVSHRVRMRYRPGVTPAKRLVYRGRVLNILSAIDVGERRRELEMLVEEVTG